MAKHRTDKNDPFYALMKDSRLELDAPAMEENVLQKLEQIAYQSRRRKATRRAVLFLLLPLCLGIVLCLFCVSAPLSVLAGASFSILLQGLLVLIFLFLLEKLLQLTI